MKKTVLLTIGVIIVGLISSPFWVPRLLDFNSFRQTFEALASDASGFEISINGDIEVHSIVPALRVSVSKIEATSESPEADSPISLDHVELEVRIWPIVSGLLDIRKLHVDGFRVDYIVDEFGRHQSVRKIAASERKENADLEDASANAAIISNIRLADIRMLNSALLYENKQTGQSIRTNDINLNARLANLDSTLELSGTFTVNDRPVLLTANLETPQSLLDGNGARLVTGVNSDILQVDVDLKTGIAPTIQAAGSIDLHIPSVGKFANWLGHPLNNEEDPGPVHLTGRISGSDAQTTLQSLVFSGDGWDLKASGEIIFAESPTELTLNVEGGRIDLDRYLPQPIKAPRTVRLGGGRAKNETDALDESIDLSTLRDFRGDVRVALEGVKIEGFEIGETSFRAKLEDGLVEAELGELNLYGGRLVGLLSLDASRPDAAFDAKLAIDRVDLHDMYDAHEGDAFVRGEANGFLNLQSHGTTPRQLVEHLAGSVLFELDQAGEIDASERVISRANAQLLLPGGDEAPYILGRFIYAGELFDFDIEAESVPKIVTGQTFGVDASIVSDLIDFAYQGDVFQRPIFSLDGKLSASIPSAGRLASLIGSDLPSDPGAVTVKAAFESDGTQGRILEARVQGTDLEAELKGDFDVSGDVSRFNLQVETGVLRIDRYLSNSSRSPEPLESQKASGGGTILLFEDLSRDALDFEPLRRLEVDAEIQSAGAVLPDLTIGHTAIRARAKNGEGGISIDRLEVEDGSVTGEMSFDVTSDPAAFKFDVQGNGLDLDALTRVAQRGTEIAPGNADFSVHAETSGNSEHALLTNLSQAFEAHLDAVTLDEQRSLEGVSMKVSADSPGSGVTLDMSAVLKDSASAEAHDVAIVATTDPLTDWLSDQAFAVQGSARVGEFKLETTSEVAHPMTDPEPTVTIKAAGESLSEIGTILNADLPAIGPYVFESRLALNNSQIEVPSFNLALGQSRASGTITAVTNDVRPAISGQIQFDPLDLTEIAGSNVGQAESQPQGDGMELDSGENNWIFSEEPLPFEVLSYVDIPHLQLTFSKLHIAENITVDDLRTEIVLENGNLRLAPFVGELYDGKLEGEFEVSATAPNSIGLLLNGTGMDYGALLSAFNITDEIHGRLDTRIELQSQGKSMRAIASSVSGRYELEAKDGQIDRDMLGLLAFGSGTILGPLFGEDDAGNLRCIVTAIEFEDGIGDTVVQYYDTSFFAMGGEGKIDLKSETLDFVYNPKSSEVSLMKLAVPFRVSGPLREPSVLPDTGGTLLTAAKTAGTIASFINPLVGLGVLAAGKIAEDSDPCETARMIKRGEIARKKSDEGSGGIKQTNTNK